MGEGEGEGEGSVVRVHEQGLCRESCDRPWQAATGRGQRLEISRKVSSRAALSLLAVGRLHGASWRQGRAVSQALSGHQRALPCPGVVLGSHCFAFHILCCARDSSG